MSSLNMEQQAHSSSKQFPIDVNEELTDSDRWTCMTCIWGRKSSDEVPSESTTEDLTQSSTDPTDTSSLKEDIKMVSLNPDQQASSHVSDVANSGKWTCIKKCFSCQNSDAQEPTETNDELTQSSTDPTDFNSSPTKEGIEMDSLRLVQSSAGPAVRRAPTDGVNLGITKEDSVNNAETANLQDEPLSANVGSPDLALETEV